MAAYRKSNPLMEAGKRLLPSRKTYLPIVAGPFRGGVFYANPRVSLRKVLGLYEAELNAWVTKALKRTDLVLDVGANDGYFTFGAVSGMRRAGHAPRVVAFEPLVEHVAQLETAKKRQKLTDEWVTVIPKMVGNRQDDRFTTLDALRPAYGDSVRPLIKIDVEGAELDVLDGAAAWITPRTMLLIEVHQHDYIERIRTMLAGRTAPLELVEQKALPLLGREMRDVDNWWLVSKLD